MVKKNWMQYEGTEGRDTSLDTKRGLRERWSKNAIDCFYPLKLSNASDTGDDVYFLEIKKGKSPVMVIARENGQTGIEDKVFPKLSEGIFFAAELGQEGKINKVLAEVCLP